MSIPEKTSVLIAGAGPSGMIAALTLHRTGVSPVVIEKSPTTRRHSQAAVIWPRTLDILDLLGIVEDWRPRSTPVHGFTLSIDGELAGLDLRPVPSPHPQPWAVGQDVTEALLDARIRTAGIPLFRQMEAVQVKLKNDGAVTTVRSEDGSTRTITSDWVIGCEGSHSVVRAAAGIERTGGQNAGVQLIQGDVRLRGPLALEPGRGYLWSRPERETLLAIPTSVDGHYRVIVTVPDDGNQDAPSLELLQSLVQRFIPGEETYDPVWLNRYRTQHQLAESYRHGRAFIAGDASHVWVPIGGQGMNVAMQDAFDLGWKLGAAVRGELPPAVLDTHTTERRPIAARTIADTERAYKMLIDQQGTVTHIQRRLFPLALGFAPFQSAAVTRFAEVAFEYPESALVADHGGTDGHKAGQPAPDAWVTEGTETKRLFDLYRAGKWLILGWTFDEPSKELLETMRATASEVECVLIDGRPADAMALGWRGKSLRDVGRLAAGAFGVRHEVIHVIRPDGVIGYRGKPDPKRLSEYLGGVFPLQTAAKHGGNSLAN